MFLILFAALIMFDRIEIHDNRMIYECPILLLIICSKYKNDQSISKTPTMRQFSVGCHGGKG